MDDAARSSGALVPPGTLTLTAPPAPTAPTLVVRPVDDVDLPPRLAAVRRRLAAEAVALVAWDTEALRVVALDGTRLSGSTALAVGVACAEVDRAPQNGRAVVSSAGGRLVHVAPLTRTPLTGNGDGSGGSALVVVDPRPMADLSPEAVGDLLRQTFSAS